LCDNCTKGEVEQVDASVDAQKLLSAIYRTEQRFGLNHIIDILRGSKNQKLLEFEHDKLSVYNLGVEKSKNEWIAIADKLIDIQALLLGEFRVLKISNLGLEILKGKEKLLIDSDKLGIASKIEEDETELSFDELIYERFKTLRREIALEHQVPAYVIFGDKTLKEFASKLPITKELMLEINGVGLVKFEKYGETFLNLCKDIKEEFSKELENKEPLKKLTKTYLETLEFLTEGKSVEDIAQIRDLGITSVLGHISVLFEHKKISKEKKEELLKPLEIPQNIVQWIEDGLKLDSFKELRQSLYLYEYLKKEL
jgi:ATP-dependent DNA helicase RecQ